LNGRVSPSLAGSDPLAEARERDERARVGFVRVPPFVVLRGGGFDEGNRVVWGNTARARAEAVEGLLHLDEHGEDILVGAVRVVRER
jgi:hypothetical protein